MYIKHYNKGKFNLRTKTLAESSLTYIDIHIIIVIVK